MANTIIIIDAPGIGLISDFMISNSSMLISLNITAGTVITIDDYYTLPDIPQFPDLWFNKTTLYINGSLSWDNSAPIDGMRLNVTVQWKINGTVIAYNYTAITNASGNFIATIFITDNDNWPLYRSDTKIVVYFDAKVNNLDHAENSNYTSYL